MSNKMKEVAALYGLELNEPFKVNNSSYYTNVYAFSIEGVYDINDDSLGEDEDALLLEIITGVIKIEKVTREETLGKIRKAETGGII